MTVQLPPMPDRIKRLPRDKRGFPTPWFVCWMRSGRACRPDDEGAEPDFRVIGPGKFMAAVRQRLCWVCGEPLGQHCVYVIGPMCVVNRVTSEPPCHRSCAEFSAQACPFLTRPRQKRDRKDLPEDTYVAGIHIDRNPGAVALYECRRARLFQAGQGFLFGLDKPSRVDWYANGRKATRAEIEASIESGLPLLFAEAEKDGADAVRALRHMTEQALCLLPA